MFTVNYTDKKTLDSSAINEALYDNTKNELTLSMSGGNVYRYSEVPKVIFDELVSAESPGRYYRDVIRGSFNGGTLLGYDWAMRKERFSEPVPAPDMSNVIDVKTGLRPAQGMPKALVETENTIISGSGKIYIAELPKVEKKPVRKHTVTFEVNSNVRTYNVIVESVEDALASMEEIADALDVVIKIKSVSVDFE